MNKLDEYNFVIALVMLVPLLAGGWSWTWFLFIFIPMIALSVWLENKYKQTKA
jgi:hypothetical protein